MILTLFGMLAGR